MNEDQIQHHLQYCGELIKSYQTLSKVTVLDSIKDDVDYFVHGLNSEAGEVASLAKKVKRDFDGKYSPEHIDLLVKELGDVLWYVSNLANAFNLSLGDISRINIEKLLDRQSRGVIGGSGDHR